MQISTALLVYLFTIVICLVLPALAGFYAKKKQQKLNGLHFLIGLLVFFVAAVGYFLLFKYHLTVKDGVGDYYNTAFYRVAITSFITVVVLALLWVFAMRVYVKRQATQECLSFYVGFGCSGVALLGLYSLYMFVQLLIMLCTRSLLPFDTVKQAFHFSPDTFIFVFSPIWGHISYAIAFFSFLFIAVCFAMLLNRLARANIPFWVSLVGFVVLVLSLTVVLDLAAFINLLNMTHYAMAIVAVVLDVIVAAVVRFAYISEKKSDADYDKQFD